MFAVQKTCVDPFDKAKGLVQFFHLSSSCGEPLLLSGRKATGKNRGNENNRSVLNHW